MKKTRCNLLLAALWLLAGVAVSSCSTTDGDEALNAASGFDSMGEHRGEGGQGGNTQAGIVTAGEWCDLDHWAFWSKLMLSEEFKDKGDYWEFHTNQRVAVRVTDAAGRCLAGVPVALLRQTEGGLSTLWTAVTDNHGQAQCWVGLFQKTTAAEQGLRVSVGGQLMDGAPTVCPLDTLLDAIDMEVENRYVLPATAATASRQADIAFIVDATGSMGDEIRFLKSDLVDIIGKVGASHPELTVRTGALFYRDEGDDYLTRHSDFTTDLDATARFVGQQGADGGGDYPEAVHSALEHMLQDLSWDTTARTRLAFMLLDAPAHHEQAVIRSLQQSVQLCARQGIRLIPVAASGVDKNTEFMLRFFAIATGGTYVFLTNDSGVGNDHMAASVGDYQVEPLNSLLIRLIDYYSAEP